MSLLASSPVPPQVVQTMSHLSQKPGVLAVMAIDRSSSTILATSGNSSLFSSVAPAASSASTGTSDFALMIRNHVQSTMHVVHAMDTEDNLQLLRIRTKRHELLIVPDPKYIFVAINEVPGS